VRQPALDPAEDVDGTQKVFIVSFVLMVTVSYPNQHHVFMTALGVAGCFSTMPAHSGGGWGEE
jgi:hypothetical protein